MADTSRFCDAWTDVPKKMRVYIDTSVLGGCFDREFSHDSLLLLEMVKRGEVLLIISPLLIEELQEAPEKVRGILEALPESCLERTSITEDALALQDKYLQANILSEGSADDALHVALATVAEVDLIVIWNFRHIVHFDKIRRFNAINMFAGFRSLDIRSPKEVV